MKILIVKLIFNQKSYFNNLIVLWNYVNEVTQMK